MPAPVVSQPASPQTIDALRQSYRSYYPNSRLGPVIAVRSEVRLAAVDEIAAADVAEGQIVSFIDSSQHVLTTGHIVRILPGDNRVHVRYDPPPTGGRDPRVGDIMVRF